MYSEGSPSGGRETSTDPLFDSLSDVFDYPPELRDEIARLMDSSAQACLESQELLRQALEAETNHLPSAGDLMREARLASDHSTTDYNYAEYRIKAFRRKQKINKAASRILGVIRKPLELTGLGHDAAAEALPAAIENSGLAGG